jgi:hypothetical protein
MRTVMMALSLFLGGLSTVRSFTTRSVGMKRAVRCCTGLRAIGGSTRLPSDGASLDTNLLANNPDLVISHLRSRRSSEAILQDVEKIAKLRTERNALIVSGDAAKNIRKTLSQQIGKLMKDGKTVEVEELKRQVEEASIKSAEVDVKLNVTETEINRLFAVIPNLLDDR